MKSLIRSTSRPRLNALVAALGVSLMIAACGGGGGGGGDAGGGGPVAPQAWSVAELLERADGQAGEADVSINANGVGYAVWQQLNGGERDVFASRYRDGVWEEAQPLTGVNSDAFEPQVAVLSDGEAVAIWRQAIPVSGTEAVLFNKTVGGVWQGAQFLQDVPGSVGDLELAADTQGNAMAVWQRRVVPETNPRSHRIFANAFRGGAFEGTEQVNIGATDAKNPDIAIDSEGNVLAVWSQFTGGQYRILARSNVGGIWLQDTRPVSDPNEILDMDFPTVSAGANGRASVAWQNQTGTIETNVASNFTAGAWGVRSLVDTSATGFNSAVRVAMDMQGNTTIVWLKQEGVRNLYAQRRSPDGSISLQRKIDVDDTGDAGSPRLGTDASGRVIVVWEQSINNARIDLMSSRLESGSVDWLSPESIENDNAGSAVFPALAVNPSGRAIAAWQQNVGFVNPILGSVMANIFK